MFVPFWYVKTTATNYKKAISSELETALSIITTAYLRNEDIITSIEENVHYLNAPVKAVFENFISRIKLSNPDITAAILDMIVGQIVLAISAVGIFISTAIVIKLTKPIEYKR